MKLSSVVVLVVGWSDDGSTTSVSVVVFSDVVASGISFYALTIGSVRAKIRSVKIAIILNLFFNIKQSLLKFIYNMLKIYIFILFLSTDKICKIDWQHKHHT